MIGAKAMKELSLLKRELKCWENMFERTHGRKPNKDDISVGPAEIRESYRKYRELKELVSKTSKDENKRGEDDVFGKNLNKKKEEEKKSSLPFRKKDWADITPVRLCHGQRPKKKDSPKEIAIEGNVDKNNILDASGEGDKKEQALRISTDIREVKVTDTSERKVFSPAQMNIGSRILFPGHHIRNTSIKKREAISSVWLEKYKPELPGNSLCNDVSHSDDLVKNESSSDKLSLNEHNFTTKQINNEDSPRSVAMPSESSCPAAKEMVDDQANPYNLSMTEKRNGTRKFPKINSVTITERSSKEEIFKSEGEGPSNSRHTEAKKNFDSECFSDAGHSKKATNSQQVADTRGSSVTNLFGITNPTVSNTSVGESYCSSLDAPQEIMSLKRKAEERTTELEKSSKRVRHEDDNEEETFDESKVDNRADEVESEEDLPSTTSRKHSRSQRTHAKVSSGLVSDNFQRLNMKHRSYRRRGGGISGAAHKRRAWKQILKSRGEFVPQKSWSSKGRGGRAGEKAGACFKCGEEGHWAKNCRGRRKQTSNVKHCEKDAEDVEMEEFEPLPTIEEAAMMAAGIQPGDDSPGSEGLVILPHQLPRPVYTPPSPPPSVEPLYQPVDGKPVEPTKEVLSALGKLGFSSFRPGQQEAVMRILCGLSSLVVLSTGAGKSLCYQLPAFLYAKRSSCLTLVISPLVSLMEDQITGLPHGLKGACLHTNLTKAQRQKVVDDLCSGKVSVLLLSPEALVGGGSGNGCLPSVSRLPQIAFACIDEAHCVSEWSHNFRPSYLRVCKVLREKFGVRCFLGLTATATRSTAASVAEHLGIVHDPGAVIRGGAVPPNLFLSVSYDSDRTQALLQLLQGRRFSRCDSIIIYCTRREQTEKLASTLRTCLQSTRLPSGWDEQSDTGEEEKNNGRKKNTKGKGKRKSSKPVAPKWDAECYHAGLSAAQRRRVQKRFMTGQLRVVVATVAFGMGLDKPDVRAIIHYNLPRSFESYVQEIGRAGRDGLPSHCHVFLDPEGKDMCELRRHVYANTVDRSTIKKLVRRAFPRCECKKLHQQQQERNASRYDEDELLDIEYACGDMMDSNLEAELQAVELQYQKAVEDDVGKNREENEHERVKESSDSAIQATQSEQSCSSKSEETLCPGPESKAIEDGKGVESEINEGVLCHQNSTQEPVQRLCGGHEVAMVIECLIQELDMREENIATLLCYLELHARRWLEVLQPVKSTCEVKFYGGHAQLRAVAQNVPPIAAAVSHTTATPASFKRSNSISFSVVELADKMGWDLEPVCRELRALQWNTCLSRDHNLADMGQSGILVEFSDLSFHLRAPGDLSDEERDGVCDFLEDRILAEERGQLQQLQFVYDSLKSVSFSEFWHCADDVDEESDKQLKQIVRSYFEDSSDNTKKELRELAEARKGSKNIRSNITPDDHVNWDIIARDIRSLVGVHHDHSFTGRAVARIFHGIDSPCYPAEVWGRDRRFWRKHLDVEFNSLRKFATQELIKFR